jgi:hypothetical protein
MYLGIEEFRNCKLLSSVSAKSITQNPELSDFLRVHQYWEAHIQKPFQIVI